MKSFPLRIIVCILIAASGLAVFWTSRSMEAEISRRVGSSLETVLNITHEALRSWEQRTTASVEFIDNSGEIRTAVEQQLRVGRNRTDLLRSPALQSLRQVFRPYVAQRGYA